MGGAGLVLRTDRDGVACLGLHNPPVNAIGLVVRRALDQALIALEHDPAVVGVVINGTGRLFSGGGDLRELGRAEPAGAPTMSALVSRIEGFGKPVVAAVHGQAIGGGVLLAMGCHARLASPDASVLLPEVRLGFPPGAGGTQRLPRLVGIGPALKMAALAQPLDANEAHRHGFFDEVIGDVQNLLAAAVRRVHAIACGAVPWRRTAALAVPGAANEGNALWLAAIHRARAYRAFPGREAPQVAIDLVLRAARPDTGFEEGMRMERAEFERLSSGPQAKALLQQLLAERAMRKA